MPFGNKNGTGETRQYSFDIKRIEESSPGWLDAELERCRKFYNTLTAIRKDTNRQIEQWRVDNSEEYKSLTDERNQAQQQLTEVFQAVKAASQKARKRIPATEQQEADIASIKARIKALDKQLSNAKKVFKGNEEYQAFLKSINEEEKEKKKVARNSSNLHWANYNGVIQSQDGEPFPQFKKWDWLPTGRLCLQIQGFKGKDDKPPVTWERVLSGLDTRLKATILRTHKKKGKLIRMRIAWGRQQAATVEFWLHRPIPAECLISNVWLIKRKVSYQARWTVNFVLFNPAAWGKNDTATSGTCAVDWNYRLTPSGIRVAYWCGDDGNHGELVIPTLLIERDQKVRDLQEIRDRTFNEFLPQLVTELQALTLPEWLQGEASTLPQWEAQSRLMRLYQRWKENRFEGDALAFGLLSDWKTRELHLSDWQEFQRKRILRQRKHIFRDWCAVMRRRYKTFILEDCDIAKMRKNPEATESKNPALKMHRNLAAPGELLSWLAYVARDIKKVDPAYASSICNHCGNPTEWAGQLIYECEFCNQVWDCDENAARNLLRAAQE